MGRATRHDVTHVFSRDAQLFVGCFILGDLVINGLLVLYRLVVLILVKHDLLWLVSIMRHNRRCDPLRSSDFPCSVIRGLTRYDMIFV